VDSVTHAPLFATAPTRAPLQRTLRLILFIRMGVADSETF